MSHFVMLPCMPSYSTETPFPESVGYLTLPLSASLGSKMYPWGTAVLIAPGIALTARHVVDDFFEKIDGVKPRSGLTSGFGLGVYQPLPVAAMFPWAVEYIFFSPASDIAVLALKAAVDGAPVWWPEFPVLKLFPPTVGTPVTSYGYPGSHVIPLPSTAPGVWPIVGGASANDEVMRVVPATSSGEVLEFYHDGRDRLIMPWPTFRTNARYDGGMSGAPVYNGGGELCGIVCRSMPIHGTDEHESFVSAIWPALGLTIEGGSRFLPPGNYPLLDLVRGGVVRARDWEHVVATPHGDGGFELSLSYPVEPGRQVERRSKTLARVADTSGRSVIAIDPGVGPTFSGRGFVDFRCENCDAVVADGLREFQVVDVVIRCQSCATFLEFPSLPERATLSPFGRPVGQMSVGAYRISRTLELREENTMVGVRPPQPASDVQV
jgi:hypothetical protein